MTKLPILFTLLGLSLVSIHGCSELLSVDRSKIPDGDESGGADGSGAMTGQNVGGSISSGANNNGVGGSTANGGTNAVNTGGTMSAGGSVSPDGGAPNSGGSGGLEDGSGGNGTAGDHSGSGGDGTGATGGVGGASNGAGGDRSTGASSSTGGENGTGGDPGVGTGGAGASGPGTGGAGGEVSVGGGGGAGGCSGQCAECDPDDGVAACPEVGESCHPDLLVCVDGMVASDDFDFVSKNGTLIRAFSFYTSNDTPDNVPLSIISVQNASNGSVSMGGGEVTFTPDADYTGSASFAYTVSDGFRNDTAVVTVTVSD